MQDILRNISPTTQRARAWQFGSIVVVYVVLFMLMASGDTNTSEDMILNMDPVLLLVFQGILSAFMFIGFALLFARFALKLNPGFFFSPFTLQAFGLTTLITICFFVVNSAVGEWNMGLDFPDSDFETWAKRSEDQLKVLTEHLTNFTSPTHFILAMIVIAVIPAIGEELLFRGLIQNLFAKAFANHHVAIWVTGFIFAAIHLQFYGLFPRMFLGVVFGYIYHWSGKLSLAMIAHFVNNGFALLIMYLVQKGSIDIPSEQMESAAPWPALLFFGVVGIITGYIFYKKYTVANE